MPVVSRPQRTEAIQAKYNVIVDFPHLGLHSAASTGNLGLVKYALDHGQPINSVLDGVLPLHAACSGGNEHVVRLLIEKGADVNAPRLPRRFSSDKTRDMPIVGTSGSTPLHFACANGHAPVVLTLLMHGAHPDRADKHGTTPEMLARQNGWVACADILRNWTLNKDRDLREKEELVPSQSGDGNFTDFKHACGGPECRACNSKRLRVKRSIDHALNMLKPSLSQLHSCNPGESMGTALETIVASPLLPSDSVSDGLVRDSPESIASGEYSGRRPSLPDVFDPSQMSTMSRRPHAGDSASSSRRPRSAGNDAEPQSVGRRVKGKVSLLSIFKKADASTITLEGSSPGYASSSYTSSIPSVSGSPATGTPRRSDVKAANDPPIPQSKLSEETSFSDMTIHDRPRGRVFSEGEATRVPPLPTAVELHRALSRTLSNPGLVDAQVPDVSSGPPSAHRSPSSRPSILRPHNRSISQQSQGESPRSGSLGPPSSRSLRFDSTSTTSTATRRSSDARRQSSHSPARAVKMSRSVSSMRSGIGVEATRSPLRTAIDLAEPLHDEVRDEHHAVFEDEEEEYGEPITTPEAITELDSRLTALQVTKDPKRNSMLSQASLSPLPSPTKVNAHGFECPFSINEPPPQDVDSPTRQTFRNADGNENRMRGGSMSSMSTTGTNGYLPTPGMQHMQLPSPWITPSTSTPPEYPAMDHGSRRRIQRTPSSTGADVEPARVLKKGPPSALDINVGDISSYAQAEALVQRTQQSILELQDVVVTPQVGTAVGAGQTPLSAKLAAYGESLAIERKFRQEEEERRHSSSTVRSRRPSEYSVRPSMDAVGAIEASVGSKSLDRKFSLEERSHNPTIKQSKVRRPHTAGSTTSSDIHLGSPSRHGRSIPSPRNLPASGSQLNVARSSSDQRVEGLSTSYTPPMSSFLNTEVDMYAGSRPRVPRSRTPDPGRDDPLYCHASPKTTGVPLSRISTAPVQDCAYLRPQRGMTAQERQAARATKLVKMGFNADSQSASVANRQHAANRHRYGGFKGFVQSLNMIGK